MLIDNWYNHNSYGLTKNTKIGVLCSKVQLMHNRGKVRVTQTPELSSGLTKAGLTCFTKNQQLMQLVYLPKFHNALAIIEEVSSRLYSNTCVMVVGEKNNGRLFAYFSAFSEYIKGYNPSINWAPRYFFSSRSIFIANSNGRADKNYYFGLFFKTFKVVNSYLIFSFGIFFKNLCKNLWTNDQNSCTNSCVTIYKLRSSLESVIKILSSNTLFVQTVLLSIKHSYFISWASFKDRGSCSTGLLRGRPRRRIKKWVKRSYYNHQFI